MNKTGEVKERGFFWRLFNNEPQEAEEDIIETSEEKEKLKKSEERIKKMIDLYKIENFESFGVAKKTPRIKKAQIKQATPQIEASENQIEKEDLER